MANRVIRLLTGLVCLALGHFDAQTAPAQAAGYRLAFSDEFTSFDLSPTGFGSYNWYPGIWFRSKIPPRSAISARDSTLDLMWARNDGMQDTSIEGYARDGSAGKAFRYGYFEARMKWDVTTGAWPAFWMIPKQGIGLEQQHTGEIDIFEGQGGDRRGYYGTLHEWNGRTQLWANTPGNRYELPLENDFSEWHTYGLLWVPGEVTWYFDNKAVASSKTTAIFDQQDYFVVLSIQEGAHWSAANLDGVTAESINLNVDWVHVWQKPRSASASIAKPH